MYYDRYRGRIILIIMKRKLEWILKSGYNNERKEEDEEKKNEAIMTETTS